MSSRPNVLFVLTSHDEMGTTGNKTGWYLPEFAHPFYVIEGSANITVASPKGGTAPLDPTSVKMFGEDPESKKFLAEQQSLWVATEVLANYLGRADEFDAIFYVGGHGPMFDLATDQNSITLIREFFEKGKIVGAVCHGPAAFVNVTLSNGEHLLKGQPVTGFSDAEEDAVQLTAAMPFSLEQRLNSASEGKYEKAGDQWAAQVSIGHGGRLITGQNPNSAKPLGEALLKQIGAQN